MNTSALAACIGLARKAAGYNESPTSEVYWHTRELCFELAKLESRKRGVTLCSIWSSILSLLKDYLWADESSLKETAVDLWEETMHPMIVVCEVHEVSCEVHKR